MDLMTQMVLMGAAAQGAPVGGDPYFANTSLLVNADGQANGATTFIDLSPVGQTLTRSGAGATISTAQAKYGSGSISLDGTAWIDTASNAANTMGTGDFTLEAWIRPANISTGWRGIYHFGPHAYDGLYHNGADLRFYRGTTVLSMPGVLAATVWSHVAVSRSGTSVRIFANGIASGVWTSSYDFSRNAGRIGANLNGSERFTGHMDDLRLTKGIARYTANFTPPDQHPTF